MFSSDTVQCAFVGKMMNSDISYEYDLLDRFGTSVAAHHYSIAMSAPNEHKGQENLAIQSSYILVGAVIVGTWGQ